ncbi:G5 domain-containing protein [Arthrobacter sp. MDT1-65]
MTVSEEWVEEPVAFTSRRQDDPNLDRGVEALAIAGVAGVKATRFLVTLTDGIETGRVAAGEEMRAVPVEEVIAVGTKAPVVVAPPTPVQAAVPAAGGCDPNYDGDCVPIDSDVDCASGSGNGPSYVQGPVRIVGSDIYGLDRNGDGFGCE